MAAYTNLLFNEDNILDIAMFSKTVPSTYKFKESVIYCKDVYRRRLGPIEFWGDHWLMLFASKCCNLRAFRHIKDNLGRSAK